MSPDRQPPTPVRLHRLRNRLPWVLTALALMLGVGSGAYAYWASVTSSTFAAASAATVTAVAKPAVTVSGTALTVTWTASTTAGRSATGYTVIRYAAATGAAGVAATGGCAGTITSLSCTEQNVQGGIWYYTVTPAIALWKGAESPRSNGVSNDSTAPVASVATISPTPNAAGWNNSSPVTVSITAQDGAEGSGVASITYAVDSGTPVTVKSFTAAVPVSGNGTHTVSYFATDVVGNASVAKNQSVKIDTVAPGATSLIVPAYVNRTNVAAVPVSGTAEVGGTVSLTIRDSGSLNTITVSTTVSGTGNWTLSPNLTTLNEGTLSFAATVTDPAGNTGAPATATSTKDTAAPLAPSSLSVPTYVNAANVSAVPVSGSAEAGSTVTLTVTDVGTAHTVTAVTTASGNGTWSFTLNLGTLNQGTLTFTASAKDAAGNTGAPATATDSKDTAAPGVPTLSVPPSVNIANVSNVTVSGTAEAGSTVTLTVSDGVPANTLTASATASGTGSWSLTGLNFGSLNQGTLTYSASAKDAAGNSGTAATTSNKKDVQAPTVLELTLANGTGNGNNASTAAKADAGDTVTIKYSEPMDLTKFCPATWNGSTINGTVTLTDGGTNDTLSFSGTGCATPAIGTISLGGNYIGTTAAKFTGNGSNSSSLTWDPARNSLIIKLGTLEGSPSGAPLSGVTGGTPGYSPSSTLSDLAANPISTTFNNLVASGF